MTEDEIDTAARIAWILQKYDVNTYSLGLVAFMIANDKAEMDASLDGWSKVTLLHRLMFALPEISIEATPARFVSNSPCRVGRAVTMLSDPIDNDNPAAPPPLRQRIGAMTGHPYEPQREVKCFHAHYELRDLDAAFPGVTKRALELYQRVIM